MYLGVAPVRSLDATLRVSPYDRKWGTHDGATASLLPPARDGGRKRKRNPRRGLLDRPERLGASTSKRPSRNLEWDRDGQPLGQTPSSPGHFGASPIVLGAVRVAQPELERPIKPLHGYWLVVVEPEARHEVVPGHPVAHCQCKGGPRVPAPAGRRGLIAACRDRDGCCRTLNLSGSKRRELLTPPAVNAPGWERCRELTMVPVPPSWLAISRRPCAAVP